VGEIAVTTTGGRALLDLLHGLSPGGHYTAHIARAEEDARQEVLDAARSFMRATEYDQLVDAVRRRVTATSAAVDPRSTASKHAARNGGTPTVALGAAAAFNEEPSGSAVG
jgi:hypothetical protein